MRLLFAILEEMAAGNAVTLAHAELTMQQAANVLNVSRPFPVYLLDDRKPSTARWHSPAPSLFADLMHYKHQIDADRRATLDQLTQDAQALKMGY